MGLIPGLGRSSVEGSGKPPPYSFLGNRTDRGTWQAIVHGVTKNRTQLSAWAHTHTHITEGESGQGCSLHAAEKPTKQKVAFTVFKGKKTQHNLKPWLPPYHPQSFELWLWYQKIAGSYIKSERTVKRYRNTLGGNFLTQHDLFSNIMRKLVCQSWLALPPRSW